MKKPSSFRALFIRFLTAVPGLCVGVYCAYAAVTLLLNVFVDKALVNFFVPNLLKTPNLVLIWFSLLSVAVMVLLTRVKGRPMSDRRFIGLLSLGFVLVYLTQLFILDNMWIRTGWDPGGILTAAEKIAFENARTVPEWYFGSYPHNFVLVYTQAVILKIAGLVSDDPYRVLLGVNALLVCLSVYMASLCVFRCTRSKAVTVISAAVGVILLAFSPWISVMYSDTPAMFFVAGGMFCFFHGKSRVSRYVSLALFCFVGYLYKPTVLILYVAFLILTLCGYLLQLLRGGLDWRDPALLIVSLVLALAVSIGIRQGVYALDQTDLDPDAAYPITHFLLMGHNIERDGVYSDEDVSITDETLPENRVKLHIRLIKNRIRAMGLKGYATFLIRKNINTFNDGTFAWGWEGGFYQEVNPKNTGVARALKGLYYTEYDGKSYYPIFAGTEQVLWLAVLLLISLSFLGPRDNAQALLNLSLLGISLYLLIFETRARYLLQYTPVFLTLAGIGLQKVSGSLKKGLSQRR